MTPSSANRFLERCFGIIGVVVGAVVVGFGVVGAGFGVGAVVVVVGAVGFGIVGVVGAVVAVAVAVAEVGVANERGSSSPGTGTGTCGWGSVLSWFI